MSGPETGSGFEWAYRDLLIALLVVFMAMAALAVVATTKQTSAGVRQGGLAIQMSWQMSANADMDLWVRAPGDTPVGYSHMGGEHCNLLRDDLGRHLDPESRNEEMTICRGVDPGEWVVDVMLYRSYDGQVPVKVTVTVTRLAGAATQMLSRTVEVPAQGDQVTVFRFRLDAHGDYLAGSENFLPMPLYGGGEATQMQAPD
ncbi:MAG: hypothetical protein ACREFP_04065 [Acetobacteraceae bacterium]